MKISIIIINFNSRHFLKKCLASFEKNVIAAASGIEFEFIILNSDTDPLVLNKYPNLKITAIDSVGNIGFAKAANLGATKADGEFLFFLNPDTSFPDDSILQMFAYLKQNSSVGICGPQIIEADKNRPQPWTCGKKTSLSSILFRNSINKPWNKKQFVKVDWVSGTALLIRKNLFNLVGGFDENYFMYFEDQDLCLKIQSKKYQVVFYPQAKVVHYNGKSFNDKAVQKKYFYQSQEYFFFKHYGWLKAMIFKFIRYVFKGQ